MPTLLQLDSSVDVATSRTRRLTAAFAAAWLSRGDGYRVVTRDLHTAPLPHLVTPAQHWPERLRGGAAVPDGFDDERDAVLAELFAADAVVIGAPMYNYSMPSTLKTWLDHVHIPGIAAPFDVPTQPMAGRPVVVVTARGGAYDAGTPQADWDHVTPPLRIALGEGLGMTVTVVATSRTLADQVPDLGVDAAAADLAAATAEVERLGSTL